MTKREPPTPVRLTASERAELQAGADALNESISATLRTGGLKRARRALKLVTANIETDRAHAMRKGNRLARLSFLLAHGVKEGKP